MDVFTVVLITGVAAGILILGAIVQRRLRPPEEEEQAPPSGLPPWASDHGHLEARVRALEAELARVRRRLDALERERAAQAEAQHTRDG